MIQNIVNSGGKVTLSCRILPEQKLQIAKHAKDLGLSMCQYVEALVLKNHTELQNDTAEKLTHTFENHFSDRENVLYQSLLQELQELHPKSSDNQLMIGSLIHVLRNRNAWVQRNLGHYLKKLTEGKYDYITEKTKPATR
jgi:hypothetical protein